MTKQFRVCRQRPSGIIEAVGLHVADPYKDLKQKNFSLLNGFRETPERTREVGCP